jgi:hypothetical protein
VIPPEYFRVFSSRMAPKMIHSTPTVITRPCRVEASTRLKLMSQTKRPMAAVSRYTIGIARLAGQRRPTSRTAASRIGEKARKASIPGCIGYLPFRSAHRAHAFNIAKSPTSISPPRSG